MDRVGRFGFGEACIRRYVEKGKPRKTALAC